MGGSHACPRPTLAHRVVGYSSESDWDAPGRRRTQIRPRSLSRNPNRNRPPSPPEAILSISPGPAAGPLGVEAHTPFVFDGSASTGDGLTYRMEFGDGASADTETATHVVGTFGPRTARLTVTDRLGRSASYGQQARLLGDFWASEGRAWDWRNRIVYLPRTSPSA